jgi:hypothetical protein
MEVTPSIILTHATSCSDTTVSAIDSATSLEGAVTKTTLAFMVALLLLKLSQGWVIAEYDRSHIRVCKHLIINQFAASSSLGRRLKVYGRGKCAKNLESILC